MRAPALLLLAALAGCSLNQSTYQESTLEAVIRHQEPSRNERYLIDMPAMAAVRRNLGIIRQGSLFAVIAGPDLQGVVRRWPKGVRYGVHLEKEPRMHLVVERVFAGDEVVDLFEGRENFRYPFPRLVDPVDVPRAEYATRDPTDLGATGARGQLSDVPFAFEAPNDSVIAVLEDRSGMGHLDRPRYFVGPPAARWFVTNRDPTTLLMLDFLRAEKRGLSGGVLVVEALTGKERAASGLAGMIEIRWIHLGGSMFFLAA